MNRVLPVGVRATGFDPALSTAETSPAARHATPPVELPCTSARGGAETEHSEAACTQEFTPRNPVALPIRCHARLPRCGMVLPYCKAGDGVEQVGNDPRTRGAGPGACRRGGAAVSTVLVLGTRNAKKRQE